MRCLLTFIEIPLLVSTLKNHFFSLIIIKHRITVMNSLTYDIASLVFIRLMIITN